MEKVRTNKMGREPILKLIVTMSIPIMFSMLIISLYNIIDSYFVSLISEKAFRAVSLTFPIQQMIMAVSLGLGAGINSLAARRLGQDKIDEANNVVAHGFILSLLFSVFFIVLGLFFSELAFVFFTNDPSVRVMGVKYMRIVTVFSFISITQVTQEKSIQSTGSMLVPMLSQLVGAVLNIILDPILIFGYFGFPELGVSGAAIATMFSQLIGAMICIIYLKNNKGELTLSFKNFKFSKDTVGDIMEVGLPTIVMQSIPAVLNMAMNKIITPLSEVGISVLSIYFKLQSFVFMPAFGLTQSVLPIIGYNYGAEKKSRIDETLKIGFIIIISVMLFGTILFQAIPEKLVNIFNATPEMVDMGVVALKTISIGFIPAALGILSSTFFQALGHGKASLMISALRQLILILPLAKIFSNFGINYVWMSYPIAEFISCVLSILMLRWMYGRIIAPMEDLGQNP